MKRRSKESLVDLLEKVASTEVTHVSIASYQLTPFDAYAQFLEEAERIFTPEEIQTLRTDKKCDRISQILTPQFVCYLAMQRLKRILSCG